ncbi:MAG: hypothetical protein ACXWYD_16170 [Candidatus Binatia bacterium]
MALDIYRRKRDFHRTPEPRGVTGKSRGTSFVIHKHAARRPLTAAGAADGGRRLA